MLRLNAFVQVAPEHRDAVIAEAKQLVEKSLAEAGCKGYDIFCSATRPDVLMFCETWADEDALAAHSASEHFAKHVGAIEAVAKLYIEKFTF